VILAGKTVVVCGVGDGLGGEVARLALRDGANAMLAARTESNLEKLAQALDPSGARVAWRATDVTDADQAAALCDAAAARFGGVDALVQVAALDAVFGSVQESPLDDWRRTFEINVLGSLTAARAVAPHLRKRGGGAIVLIGSQASFRPITDQPAYAASKGALHTAMFYMARELGADGIRVNTVVPTWMWGPPVQAYVRFLAKQQQKSEAEVVAGITSDMAIKEIPADEDVAEAVVFLCSDRARRITGQSLLVNSGQLML
jgi:NAD(P)-dependent dehydrogenase (short-subunit alcohol dehydrogenase family)